MKIYLLLATCLTFATCYGQETNNQSEVIRRLDSIEKELKKIPPPTRWATVDKSKITVAIYIWSQEKLSQSRAAEALPPETEAKVKAYEALKSELLNKGGPTRRIPSRPTRISAATAVVPPATLANAPLPSLPEASTPEKELDDLTKRVAEAKEPVAEIVDRRERQAMQLRAQYTVENLTAEYAKGRYDLVIDSREKALFQGTPSGPDITDDILALLKAKTQK